jgi:hypothetical protein
LAIGYLLRRIRATECEPRYFEALTSATPSETVISFRGSEALKQRLAQRREASRAGGEKFNEWMARVIESALDAEDRDSL